MPRRPYATPEQLAVWTGQAAPADAERLLARAGEDLDSALLTALYGVDDDGNPTDPQIVAALSSATCAQVEYWIATGDDGTGAGGVWGSVSIGPVSLSARSRTSSATGDVELAPRRAGAALCWAHSGPGDRVVSRVPLFLLRHRVSVEPYLGDSAYGKRYGPAVAQVPALVAETVRQVRAPDGRVVTSTAQVIADPGLACPVGSRLTLPGGRTTTAIAVAHHTAPGLAVPACTEVSCE
ncbi:hypothetical protein ACFWZT_00815 [Streptomyces alboflavus]|uniref:hypothetical protein n=1 Tax=Streptomyces alboflavus TaxID=67267 RepID=UPI0036A95F4A